MLRHHILESPAGPLTLVETDNALSGVYFAEHRGRPNDLGPAVDRESSPVISLAARQLEEYFRGERREFSLPLAPAEEEFAAHVRGLLLAIPFGERRTYGQLAAELGGRSYSQAVGGAVGRNPLSIIVPCHRVLGADGTLTGFAGGTTVKALLLELEESDSERAARLF